MEKTVTLEDVLAVIDKMAQETRAMFRESDKQIAETRAMFQESDKQIAETRAMFEKTDKQIAETGKQLAETKVMFAKTDLDMKAMFEKTDKQIAETDKQVKATHKRISELGGRLGEIIEYIVSPHLEKKFEAFHIFLNTVIVEHTLEEPGKGIIAEIDVFLSNGEYAVAVEAKSKPSIRDIREHVERMKKIRGYADRHQDRRKYLGVIAGMVVSEGVKQYAFRQGFLVLTPSGESVELEYPEGKTPKEW